MSKAAGRPHKGAGHEANGAAAAVWVDPGVLKPWAKNPRKNDGRPVDEVAKSIERFGFAAPIVANKDGEVIAGHTRLKAAKKLGLTSVPVRYVDLPEKEAHALAVADNKLGELAEWDDDLLRAAIDEVEDVSGLGFDERELRALMNEPEQPDVSEPGGPSGQRKDARTRRGDVWTLGKHRLLCGDCRDAADVAMLVDGSSVNVAFTSPPYASQRKYDESSGFKPIHPDDFVAWFEAVQANVRAHLASDGSWFVNIKEHCDDGQRSLYVKDLTIAHVREWGWRFVDEFCWRNTKNGVPGGWNNRFKNAFEPVFHFATQASIKFRPDAVSVPSDDVFEYSPDNGVANNGSGLLSGEPVLGYSKGLARPSNVVDVAAAPGTDGHSAAFPIGLPTFFIRAFTDAGDVVFDPFMGSGTTLIACENEGRIALGTEISPAYCDIIVDRWEKLTGRKALRNGQLVEA